MNPKTANMTIKINKPKVSTGTVGGEFVLLHLPTDNFVTLDDKGKKIWEKIESGNELEAIIGEYSKENNISKEVASFQVISFLDELRNADLISFDLNKDTAPLLDMPVKGVDKKNNLITINRTIVHETDDLDISLKYFLQQKVKEKFSVDKPDPDKKLEEFIKHAGSDGITGKKILIADSPDFDLSLKELVNNSKSSSNRVLTVNKAKDALSLRDILTVNEASFSSPVAVARIIIVVIIIIGPIIVIVIIDTGPGPSAGKSRSACKTMCV